MKIYTRQGDAGQTRLPHTEPMCKDAPALEVCGTIDELNAAIGLARSEVGRGEVAQRLHGIQKTLLQLAAEFANPELAGDASQTIGPAHVEAFEAAIDRYDSVLAPLHSFILPGNSRAEAALHVARTVCRRAERRTASLGQAEPHRVGAQHFVYLNRLSDLLFVLARVVGEGAELPPDQT